MAQASYDKLEDESYFGRVPSCTGVAVVALALRCVSASKSCNPHLKTGSSSVSTMTRLPVIDEIDLNTNLNMSRWAPCKRREFIRRLHSLGFEGPVCRFEHQFMTMVNGLLAVPSNAGVLGFRSPR